MLISIFTAIWAKYCVPQPTEPGSVLRKCTAGGVREAVWEGSTGQVKLTLAMKTIVCSLTSHMSLFDQVALFSNITQVILCMLGLLCWDNCIRLRDFSPTLIVAIVVVS